MGFLEMNPFADVGEGRGRYWFIVNGQENIFGTTGGDCGLFIWWFGHFLLAGFGCFLTDYFCGRSC